MSLFTQGNIVLQQIEDVLREIGYRDVLLKKKYEYADVIANQYKVGTIDIATFAQTPPSYRNACIGVVVSNDISSVEHVAQYQSLGAPLIFEITSSTVNRWKITGNGMPELKESISHENIINAFRNNKSEWRPDRIFRAKALGENSGPVQLDFYDVGLMPLLQGMIQSKLDKLFRGVLTDIIKTHEAFDRRDPDYKDLFRLVFRLVAAKVMRDRNYPGNWNSSDAAEVLNAVENYYKIDSDKLIPLASHRKEILDAAWKSIYSAFHFQNLSVDDLAYIYERSFITPETRKIFGTHSTPPQIIEYIVNKLPFQDLPENGRKVFEPCAGHGGFLVAAMRRLRELLPKYLTDEERHDYLVKRLTGIEIDSFALEVCWLRLVLADYPNPNGWQLYEEDVFESGRFSEELKGANVVLCNPPFQDFNSEERNYYKSKNQDVLAQKPAELLHRILLNPPALLGLVLPRNFESGDSYRRFHRKLAEIYEDIELVSLPEVFNYSDAPVTLVIASGHHEFYAPVKVTFTKVDARIEKKNFLEKGILPPAVTTSINAIEYTEPRFSLCVPFLSDLWNFLRMFPTLGNETDIHRGVNWKSSKDSYRERERHVISNYEQPGYMEGFARVEGHLMQFVIQSPQYLSMRPEDQYDNAYMLPWVRPKVVCNTARLTRGPWRIGATADPIGRAFSQRFFALWPTGKVSIYALAALLNSPLANAFVYAHEEDRDNRVKTLRAMPIPQIPYLEADEEIDLLSKKLHNHIANMEFDKAKHNLVELDAAILRAYNLPLSLERELLNIFQSVDRPIPLNSNKYNLASSNIYNSFNEAKDTGNNIELSF
jgi:hypothetical protein